MQNEDKISCDICGKFTDERQLSMVNDKFVCVSCESEMDEDKETMDRYATGEIKAVEPTEELPKYISSKWEEYYTNAVDLIEKKFSHRNRQWCHDQLNKALDNTEFHHVDDYELQCQMIDGILAGEFGIGDKADSVPPPTNFSVIESLEFIWDKLHGYREDCIPESNPDYDEEWSDICISMAWIEGGCDVERVEGILEPKNNNKTKKVTKSSKILSGRDKVIIEMQIEYDVPQGLSYAEKVQFTEDLELPTGYVEDSFGIVEFSNKKESN